MVGWEGGGVKGSDGAEAGNPGLGRQSSGRNGSCEKAKGGGGGTAVRRSRSGESQARPGGDGCAGLPGWSGGTPRGAGGGRVGSARAPRPRPGSALWQERSPGQGSQAGSWEGPRPRRKPGLEAENR